MKIEALETDVERLRYAWGMADENARAQERLAEHATAVARNAVAPPWYLHPAIWFLAGGILIGGAAVGGAVALGAVR